MYLLDILNYHVFKRHLFSTGWFENKLQKPEVSRAGQMMFNTQFFCLNLKVHCGKNKQKQTTVKILFWFLSPAEQEAVYRGGCGGQVDVQWAWHYDQGLLQFFYSMSKLMFIPHLWTDYFWSLFFINLSNFYLCSIRLTFFIKPTSVFMNVWIFHSESVFFVLNFDLDSVIFFILSLITVIFILVFVQKKDIFETL